MLEWVNRQSLKSRFDAKVERDSVDGCWKWIGSKCHSGRGTITVGGVCKRAHRVSYEMHVGKIPPGMSVHNRCGDAGCVRPDHLYLGYRGGAEPREPEFEAATPVITSITEIANQALRLETRLSVEQPGVYVLFADGEIVYVGQSKNVFKRVGEHSCDKRKIFDEWTYVVVRDYKDRLNLERGLISLHNPPHNKR